MANTRLAALRTANEALQTDNDALRESLTTVTSKLAVTAVRHGVVAEAAANGFTIAITKA